MVRGTLLFTQFGVNIYHQSKKKIKTPAACHSLLTLTLLTTTSLFSHSGEIKNGKLMLEWLSDEDNRELVDEIEHVNPAMLDQLVEQSTYLAALFCEYTSLPPSLPPVTFQHLSHLLPPCVPPSLPPFYFLLLPPLWPGTPPFLHHFSSHKTHICFR